MFKYRAGDGKTAAMNEVGWYVSQALYSSACGFGASQRYLDEPLGSRTAFGLDRCPGLLAQIDDPVLNTLWELGTLRALSDMLAHLVLRAEQPGLLRWNTADHFMAQGVNLYAINAAYLKTLNTESPA
jgi:hypothetical protein